MKAYLLAAGLGTRLRPLTERVPKCLVPINGKPLLGVWLDVCEAFGISEVLINTHHLADQVRHWAGSQRSSVRLQLAHEETLLGSAGTLAANSGFIGNDEDFYIFYADNLFHADLRPLEAFHARHRGVLTMGLFRSPKPQDCGIVTLDAYGRICTFEEKPEHPRSDFANAGIFLARRKLFDYIPANEFADLGKHILPNLVGAMSGQLLNGFLLDIGTPENYQRALVEWPLITPKDISNAWGKRANAAQAS